MAESVGFFAVKSIGLSTVNGRKACTLLDAARHNLREIQAEQGASGHINPKRSRDNAVIAGPLTATEVKGLAATLLADVETAKLKRDHCQAIEAVFALPAGVYTDAGSYFAKCLQWLSAEMALPILSAVIHHDEAAQHMHVLMLPIKNGKHVGGKPIVKPELKRLRDSFFAQVAGPAGFKREGAKLRGMAKQWAVTAVLREAVSMGLPDALGPLWPFMVAAIKQEPTAALIALNIDPRNIRPAGPNPIGLTSNPIGLQKERQKTQALSCVGLHEQTPSTEPTKAIATLHELWATVGCRSLWTTPKSSRLSVARAAQQHALARHTRPTAKTTTPHSKQAESGEVIRVLDEYSHDLSAWD